MTKKTIEELEKTANTVVHTCSTVFPFKFFPTTIEVTPTKVSIKETILPFSSVWTHILIRDLVNVRAETNPFFAKLYFEIRFQEHNPKPISYLQKDGAQELAKIVTGLIEIQSENIDPSVIQDDDSMDKIRSVGEAQTL